MKTKLFTLTLVLIACVGSVFANRVKIGDFYYDYFNKYSLETRLSYYKKYDKHMRYNVGWKIETANIPADVTYGGRMYRVRKISSNAFANCENLKSVIIPNSVNEIGIGAFWRCKNLTTITIGNRVTDIGGWAFYECTALKSITIPNGVTTIGRQAFDGCTALKSITIPNGVTKIEINAFKNCNQLTSVIWNAKKCNGYNFGSQVETFTFGDEVEEIPDSICTGMNKLTSITIPNNVRSIGNSAFDDCSGLTSVVIPNSVKSIGVDAFKHCTSLESVTIGNSVTSLKWGTFLGCSKLTSVTIPNSVTNIGGSAFMGCKSLTSVVIPNSVTSIENWAFAGCSKLKSVTIPNSVTSIGNYAFKNCKALTFLIIPNSVKSIGNEAFAGCEKLSIYTASQTVYESLKNTNLCYLVPEGQMQYYYPFSTFAKNYVEQKINEWQKKGEFERVADWQKRVNERTRQQKIQSLLTEAQNKYIDFHSKNFNPNLTLGRYDAENEVFAMTEGKFGTIYMAVPIQEAQKFQNNWNAKTLKPQMKIYGDEVKLSALTITMPDGKEYTYRNTDAVSYNLAEMEYNFAPVELNLPKTAVPKQGQVNISKTTLKVGKSEVDTTIPQTNTSNPNTFVVIIANENYKSVASVPYALNDGRVLAKYCERTLGIPATNIKEYENATYNDIRLAVAWLKNVCEKYEGEASVIFYYAGHGIPDASDKSAYLLPVDGDGRYVATGYKLDELYQKLGSMPAKSVTVLLDACFSGANRDGKMLASERGVALKSKSGVPQGNMVVFSAAQGDETALPNDEEGHGLFTYYVLKKLQESQGNVNLQELSQYVIREVGRKSAVTNKPQTPCITPSSSIGAKWQNWKLK